ncbi:MAG: hypothetical protein Q8M92_04310, partial [Candidatus Subteraquimicrobiales bacterium]|nr:hypothetical protein [Candidatus Subteraquimicrobiales bacterium]
SIMKNTRVVLNPDRIHVLQYPSMTIKGIPIPPIVAAFQDLYQRQLYQKANRSIAEDILVPLRMLFPIWKGESGASPLLKTMNMEDWSKKTRDQVDKWKQDKSHIPIMPVEIGSKNIWGEGKMLVLQDVLRANQQDILANIDVPLEFIYGGATWSRQNVSAITLENVMKAFGVLLQDFLEFVESRANKMLPKEQKIRIKLDVPRLVDGISETSLKYQMMQNKDISRRTFYQQVGEDYYAEQRNLERESDAERKRIIDTMVSQANAQTEAEKVMLKNETIKREQARREMLKDSLANRAIEKDQMLFQLYMQEYQYKKQLETQKQMAKEQIKQQRAMMPLQMDAMEQQMSMTEESQLRMAKKMQKLQTMGIKQQIKAQYKAQQELQEDGQKKQMVQQQQQAIGMMSEEEKQALMTMPPEQQSEMIQSFMQRAQIEEMYQGLPKEMKEEIQDLPESERMHAIQQLMEQAQTEEQANEMAQSDENIQKDMLKKKLDEEFKAEDIQRMAQTYNRLNVEDRAAFRAEIMQEDTSLFAKVKEMADAWAKQEYLMTLLNEEESNDGIWRSAAEKHPELLDEIMQEYGKQMMIRNQ